MKDAYGYPNADSGCISINRGWLTVASIRWHFGIVQIARGKISVRHLPGRAYFATVTMTSAYKPTESSHSCEAMFCQHLHSIHVLIALPIKHSWRIEYNILPPIDPANTPYGEEKVLRLVRLNLMKRFILAILPSCDAYSLNVLENDVFLIDR